MASTTSGKTPRPRRTTVVPAAPAVASGLPQAHLAELVSIDADGRTLVRTTGASPVGALVLGQLSREQLEAARVSGHQVLVVPLAGDATRLVVVGIVAEAAAAVRPPATARVDGRRVELTGQDEVVLTCGKASITLTRAGKVIIKGTYVSSGSAGVNRITGGSVQIN